MEDEKKIDGLYGNFVLVGKAKIAKEREKYITTGTNSEGYTWQKIQFGIEANTGNTIFVELMGGYHTKKASTIFTQDKNKNKMEVAWMDRFDTAIIDTIADYKKFKGNFATSSEKDSKVYITEYDLITHIVENLTQDKRYVVQGNFKMEKFKNKEGKISYSQKFLVQKVRLAKDDETDKAEMTLGFIFDKDSWDEGGLKEDKKVFINTYFTAYEKASKETIFVPCMLTLNCDKLDLDNNSKHKALFDLYKSYFQAERDEYFQSEWHCSLFRGAEEEEITMDDLTDDQKMQIEYGIATFDQIVKDMRGGMMGNRVSEIRLIRPTNAFEGKVNKLTNYVEDDFIMAEPEVETKDELFGGLDFDEKEKETLENLFG